MNGNFLQQVPGCYTCSVQVTMCSASLPEWKQMLSSFRELQKTSSPQQQRQNKHFIFFLISITCDIFADSEDRKDINIFFHRQNWLNFEVLKSLLKIRKQRLQPKIFKYHLIAVLSSDSTQCYCEDQADMKCLKISESYA